MKGDKKKPSLRRKHRAVPIGRTGELSFAGLVKAIRNVHEQLSRHAMKAVNVSLTVRNWLIGYYIREYEQRGSDRANYGAQLLQRLLERLPPDDAFSYRSIKLYRQFYDVYPQNGQTAPAQLLPAIRASASPESALQKYRLTDKGRNAHVTAMSRMTAMSHNARPTVNQ